MALVHRKYFKRAILNVSTLGDTDVFPLPFENHVLHDKTTEVVDVLEEYCNNFVDRLNTAPPITHSALAPAGYTGFRWATQIDPLWNTYFLGLVLSLASEIEAARVPIVDQVVFSHRYDPDGEAHIFERDGWAKFNAKSLALAEDHPIVVQADIADFYGRIYHHRIENELRYIDPGAGKTGQILSILSSFSNNVSYGLPVGGPAARMLSELVLNSIDQLLMSQLGFKFIRYADDYRFFVPDRESAYKAIGFLSEKLHRNEGLNLQRSKTRIMTASEFITATKPMDPRPGSAAKFLSLHLYYDPYSPTAEEDYERLREQLAEFDVVALLRSELFKGMIDVGLTKRLTSAIKMMDSVPQAQAVQSLLDNLDTLAPVFPHVMRAIRDSIPHLPEDDRNRTFDALRTLIESGHHLAQIDVNLAYILRVLALSGRREDQHALIRVFSRPGSHSGSMSPNVQRDIVLALARHGLTYWLHDLKPHYATMHAWARCAFIVASFKLGDEGKHWRDAAKRGYGPFEKVISAWAAEKVQASSDWQIPV